MPCKNVQWQYRPHSSRFRLVDIRLVFPLTFHRSFRIRLELGLQASQRGSLLVSPVKAEKGERLLPAAGGSEGISTNCYLEERERKRNVLWRKTNIGGKGRLHGILKQVGNFHFVLPLILAGVYLCHSYFSEFMPKS